MWAGMGRSCLGGGAVPAKCEVFRLAEGERDVGDPSGQLRAEHRFTSIIPERRESRSGR